MKRIFVTGAPATGKSTLIEYWKEYLEFKNIKFKIIHDMEAMIKLCPKDVNSEKYFYDNSGMLVVSEQYRKSIMDQQYKKLSLIWNEPFDGVVIMELSNPDISNIVKNYFRINNNDYLVVIKNDSNLMKYRNELRESWRRIPEGFMNLFDKNSDNNEMLVRKYFTNYEFLENNLTENIFKRNGINLIIKLLFT